ncbi:MAG: diaminopimelate dehydrogenase [Candidatus Anammoxibacter sp.]
MNDSIKIGMVGYGNIGRGVHKAIEKNGELYGDVSIAGIVTRRPEQVMSEVAGIQVVGFDKAGDLNPDVLILCGGSATDLPEQGPQFVKTFNTVDSFDTHAKLPDYFNKMDKTAKSNGNVAVIATGWDPGTFSLERVLADAFIPGVKPYGFYGLSEKGGLSMGHSDAIRRVTGVKDARQYTHAIPEAMDDVRSGKNPILKPGDMHWRECIVVAEDGADNDKIADEIKNMPNYFEPYKTTVVFVTQEELDKNHSGLPHDGSVIAVGTTGDGSKALIEYKNEWTSNPGSTANILVAHARAAHKLKKEGKSGAFTILDIPAAYFSPRSKEELLKDFM